MIKKSISVKTGKSTYLILEAGVVLSFVGFGLAWSISDIFHMFFFSVAGILCYGEAMMLSQQLGIVPFYYRWINRSKWSWRIEE